MTPYMLCNWHKLTKIVKKLEIDKYNNIQTALSKNLEGEPHLFTPPKTYHLVKGYWGQILKLSISPISNKMTFIKKRHILGNFSMKLPIIIPYG